MRYIVIFVLFLSAASSFAQNDTLSPADNIVYQVKDEEAMEFSEELAQFPGGMDAWIQFITDNVVYPEEAQEDQVEGVVYLKFIVDKQGIISDITVVRQPQDGQTLALEAVRLLKLSPPWTPAMINGLVVKSYMTLLVKFVLSK